MFLHIANDSDDTEVKIYDIDFTEYEDVSNAFDKLFSICQKVTKVSNEEFEVIRNSCMVRANAPMCDLIRDATNTHALFRVFAGNNKYCNWMNVNFLKIIAIACGNKLLQSLIQKYTDIVYSKTLREVWSCIPHFSVRNKYYSKLKAVFGDKDPDTVTVEELKKSESELVKEITMLIAVVQEDSLVVTWLIPTDQVYQAYLSFLTVSQHSRMDDLVQFGTWVAHPPQNVLQKYEKEINCGWLKFMCMVLHI